MSAGQQGGTIWSVLFKRMQERRDATALVYADPDDPVSWTYAELFQVVSALADDLSKRGVGAGDLVPVYAERLPETIGLYLAVTAIGAAYVPVHPGFPQDRKRFILDQVGARFLCLPRDMPVDVEIDRYVARLPDPGPCPDPLSTRLSVTDPEQPAFVIYTSGSTGQPKGVVVPNRGVIRLVCGTNHIRLGPDTVFLQTSSLAWDGATTEVYGPLLNGGVCVLYPGLGVPDPDLLQTIIDEQAVDTAFLTASLFNAIVTQQPECIRNVRQLLSGGEALSVPHVRMALERLPNTHILNLYGPTENSTCTTFFDIPRQIPEDWHSIPIGKAVTGTDTYVLDENLEPVPPGVTGELYTGGLGVALGYLNRPDLTAERFLPDPFTGVDGAKMYKTGDLVTLLPDGNIDFIGRADTQVKLRGNRIELGEIEAVLVARPAVSEAAVRVQADAEGERHLVAYYVGEDEVEDDLKQHLKQLLPGFMVPAFFARLAYMPLSSNGKLDESRLPNPFDADVQARMHAAPVLDDLSIVWRTPQELITVLWQAVLPQDADITPTVNFFDAGGTSISTLGIAKRLSRELGRKVPVVKLFEFPTIAELGAYLERSSDHDAGPDQAAAQRSARGRAARERRRRQPRSS